MPSVFRRCRCRCRRLCLVLLVVCLQVVPAEFPFLIEGRSVTAGASEGL